VSEVIRVLAVIAIIGYVIGRQLMGEPLRGKRVALLGRNGTLWGQMPMRALWLWALLVGSHASS
jgi:hypothetical protein